MITYAVTGNGNRSSVAPGRLCLCLVMMSLLGCAPKQIGPTAPSAYHFVIFPPPSVDVREREEIVVRVQDAQGQRVDGVPVVFQVAPSWTRSASVVPIQAMTQAGQAQAFFRSGVVGPVPVRIRVENTTHELTILVGPRPSHGPAM